MQEERGVAAVRMRPNCDEARGDEKKDINNSGWAIPGKANGEDHWCWAIPEYHAALFLYARPGWTELKL